MATRKMPKAKKTSVRDLKPQDKKPENVKGGTTYTTGTMYLGGPVKGWAYGTSEMAADLKKN